MLREKNLTLQSQQAQAQAQAQQQLPQRLYSQPQNRRSPHLMSLSPRTPIPPILPNFTPPDYHSPAFQPVQHVDPSTLSSNSNSYFHPVPDQESLRHHRCGSSASASSIGTSGTLCCSQTSSNTMPSTADASLPGREADLFRDLFWPSWPARLPTPELLQHLYAVPINPHRSRTYCLFV